MAADSLANHVAPLCLNYAVVKRQAAEQEALRALTLTLTQALEAFARPAIQ